MRRYRQAPFEYPLTGILHDFDTPSGISKIPIPRVKIPKIRGELQPILRGLSEGLAFLHAVSVRGIVGTRKLASGYLD